MAILAASCLSVDTITRPRAYSRPTREELNELNSVLAQRSADELRQICTAAAASSIDVAKALAKVIIDSNLLSQAPVQPVQRQHQQLVIYGLPSDDNGLPTPSVMPDEMEMVETKSPPPRAHARSQSHAGPEFKAFQIFQQQHQQQEECPATYFQPSTAATSRAFSSQPVQPVRPKKRKSLADRDDNLPTHSPFAVSSTKRTRRGNDGICTLPENPKILEPNYDGKRDCVQCGRWFQPEAPADANRCQYHPGHATSQDGESKPRWSCCQSSFTETGCVVNFHKQSDMIGILEGRSIAAKEHNAKFLFQHEAFGMDSGVSPFGQ